MEAARGRVALFVAGVLCGVLLGRAPGPAARPLIRAAASGHADVPGGAVDAADVARGVARLLEATAHAPLVGAAGEPVGGLPSVAALLDAYVHDTDGELTLVLDASGATRGDRVAATDDEAFRFHQSQGYSVVRGAVDHGSIDAFLAEIEGIREARTPVKRLSEEKVAVEADGRFSSPIKDLHAFGGSPRERALAHAGKSILLSDAVDAVLRRATGHASHVLYRSAYFEFSRTTAHQDCYYFDSDPSGELRGLWIALEDTTADGDRFFLLPALRNATDRPPETGLELNAVNAYLDAKVAGDWRSAVVSPVLKKGDAILWNSRLVHGSRGGAGGRTTRKSLIGHFLPAHLGLRSFVDPSMTMAALPKGSFNGRAYFDTERPGRRAVVAPDQPEAHRPRAHRRHSRGGPPG